MSMYRLENTVQHYAWGSTDHIPEILGVPNPEGIPFAELWLGAHPKAPSKVIISADKTMGLDELITRNPANILGDRVAERFGPRLPFLFKILAAGHALSIQAHPNLDQAVGGFKREDDLGIPRDAPHRNYRDDNHKPEIICALSDFYALRGFRPIEDIIEEFEHDAYSVLTAEVNALRSGAPGGLQRFFKRLMTMSDSDRQTLLGSALGRAVAMNTPNTSGSLRHRWVQRLTEEYSDDLGVLAPLYLNLIVLQPGQAMFLPAGELHAYLDGLGIELMANSDNVLRGGLTPKHIDVPELLKTLTFSAGKPEIILPEDFGNCTKVYKTPSAEFKLEKISVASGVTCRRIPAGSIEIVLCIEGSIRIDTVSSAPSSMQIELKQGQSLLIGADHPGYTITGAGTAFRASVP
jgi:mannose-6-phosphate isomerase